MSGSTPFELVINGKFLLASLEGMPRVGREITAQFDRLIEEDRFRHLTIKILAPAGARKRATFNNIAIEEVGRRQGLFWEQVEFPYHLGNRYSINFTATAPVVRRNGCVTVHDAQFFSSPRSHGWKSFLLYACVTPIVARRYKHVVTVSDYAKTEIFDHRVSRRPDLAVIHSGADHLARRGRDDSILARHALKPGGYLLTNSYIHEHKNVRTLFEALRGSPPFEGTLVLFGSSTRQDYEALGIPVPDRAVFLGRVTDEALLSLMQNARLFLFPSLTEGFGLPPLEAMALGCPTLCAEAGAMPEVCGDGALYASPRDPLDWRRKIETLWFDGARRETLSRLGQARAAHYTWRRAAESYLDLICGLNAAPA